MGFLIFIEWEGHKILFAGDTGYFLGLKQLGEKIGFEKIAF
jgi:hypothetical protein